MVVDPAGGRVGRGPDGLRHRRPDPADLESSARLLVGPINSDTNTLRASSQLVQTYAELATSWNLLEATVKEMGLEPEAADDLGAAVRTIANDTTRDPDDPRRGTERRS